jgi:dCMP deaminase
VPPGCERPDWPEYFLSIARVVATRADCTRRQVGAVLVKGNRIFATGYNGAPSGDPGCLTDGACPRGNSDVPPRSSYDTGPGSCVALHAEQNAIIYSSRDQSQGATLYCTDYPCDGCMRMIRGAGILKVVTPEGSVNLWQPHH